MKKAIITGICGQDGPYLAQHLLNKGYQVIGADRRRSVQNLDGLRFLGIQDDVELVYSDLLDQSNIHALLRDHQPDEFYNLAAQSFVKVSFEQPYLTTMVNSIGVLHILEAIRTFSPHTRLYQASTSEMFGDTEVTPQSETTPLSADSPYAASKIYAHNMVANYRKANYVQGCSGILFNHESPLRGKEFVTRKITSTIADIVKGKAECLELGNLDSRRDWGFAGDYVKAMYLMLQQDNLEDFVVATGQTQKVRDFVEQAFRYADIDIEWQGEGVDEIGKNKADGKLLVKVNPKFFRPTDVNLLLGDPSKAKKKLGWKAETSLEQLVNMMMAYDLAGQA